MHPVSLLCTVTLGLLLFGLALTVSILRVRYRMGTGYPSEAKHPLHRAVRAHGNAAEYIPFFAVLFVYFGMHSSPNWVYVVIIAATVSRVLHALGMVVGKTLARPHWLRLIGTTGTYITGITLSLALLLT